MTALIRIRGARTHNLKNLDLDLPRNTLIVITGLSGSGKSSLAFDTIYAEGQRRYVESLSAYARQFLSVMEKPDVDHIEGLSPAISIEQKSTSHNPRSTVGTITEIYDYLRLLYARVGQPRCPEHHYPLEAQTVSQMVDHVLTLDPEQRYMLLAPVVRERKGEHTQVFEQLRAQGFVRVRVDGELYEIDAVPTLTLRQKHTIEAVIDRFRPREDIKQRLAESFETALKLGNGMASVQTLDTTTATPHLFSSKYSCPVCDYSLPELEPRLFSFNAPMGACPACNGLGVTEFFDPAKVVIHPDLSLSAGAVRGWDRRNAYYFQLIASLAKHYTFDIDASWESLPEEIRHTILFGSGDEQINFTYLTEAGGRTKRKHRFEGIVPNLERRYRETESAAVREELAKYVSTRTCPECGGTRLNRAARNVFVADRTLPELTVLPINDALEFFKTLRLSGWRGEIAIKIVKEIGERLGFLVDVGLDYLTLERKADTLSGGEAQRIRLASQIGAGLVGVMYVLDEPSIGLHQRDNERLLGTLTRLRDLGNTVIVVEHDEDAIRQADHILDIGPGAGVHGGEICAQGSLEQIMAAPRSLTGQYLSGRRRIEIPKQRHPPNATKMLHLRGACGNNLKGVNLDIPEGLFTCITGVSGSGKSTLINDTLFTLAANEINGASHPIAPYASVDGLELFDKVVDIDQSPIGRTPRSNPATYTGMFTPLRELFAQVPEARARGYSPGRFSFNVRGGRCEACEGDGLIKVEMHFLPDVYVPCDICHGKRYNRETLEIRYKGYNINDVLEMTVEDALKLFEAVPAIARKLETLVDVGLSYLKLGQSATTLSGGEAQRVKLSKELSRRDTGHTLYILDEPTTGLHFYDIEALLAVMHKLRDAGNTVIVIEHNLDVIKTADWVIDLGPEGGGRGGEILVAGTPETVAAHPHSHTGHFLAKLLPPKDVSNCGHRNPKEEVDIAKTVHR
ncbi:excinuclease ABC subunit UvrA [Xylella fastidiosa subsp. fastidiosa]|uniref:UvrABC system protein A n=3 Tax=Xylella fastidiosa TaxID=2371 RepID=UVRA_XYLFT|nr:excinuclease ABC subunit UvrA [Xylella fastidiosa]Q87BK9.1 RecName: Full=UvrABC system protein A; Short=UvrA protein; AltName: Full=Excinuclease ABC subunit A [Xylella fastidiosa Temecula1]ADN62287.1 excinuclease ABC subunit A [Xylella fastidiosa subsp. fastidiosa GB514]KAF0570756.1 excinuclease ABC subunit A [Xylella fastidiosa subsp. fastidiosa Mus-1]AAO29288.1 excinuclease ABC subunit A [Xylella fastidiosa Temecula1]ACB92936.1 excinuclease ABC, A subunit [Xylella fastidiosa M23]EGO82321